MTDKTDNTRSAIDVQITKVADDDTFVQMPTYAYEGDAGLDIRCIHDFTLKPGQRMLLDTGIAVAIPEGFAGFLVPRSGLAHKFGLSIVNSPGIIDSHYRGEIKGNVINLGDSEVSFRAGERVMQLVILPVPLVNLVQVDALDETDRGTGGFGSSGTN